MEKQRIFPIFIKNRIMSSLDKIKNRLIDRILLTKNEQLLNSIDSIFNSNEPEEKLTLKSQQIEMLLMSEKDIDLGNLISESDLEQLDSEWMN